jgi:hypothetical protein
MRVDKFQEPRDKLQIKTKVQVQKYQTRIWKFDFGSYILEFSFHIPQTSSQNMIVG